MTVVFYPLILFNLRTIRSALILIIWSIYKNVKCNKKENICFGDNTTTDNFEFGCVDIIDSAVSVENSTFDTNTGPFTFAISRKQAVVDDDGVTNTTSRCYNVNMTNSSTEDNVKIEDSSFESGDIEHIEIDESNFYNTSEITILATTNNAILQQL